jgi:hypothetical protein
METARHVLERLRRIELLEAEGAHPAHLLAEVRALLVEAEAWVRAEGAGTGRAAAALERCQGELAAREHAERREVVPLT